MIDRHAQARGGKAAIEAVQTYQAEVVVDEGWVADGFYRATRDGSMRVDIYIDGERIFTEALDQGRGWAMQQNEEVGSPITELEERVLQRGILGNLYGLHELEGLGVELQVSGPETSDGRSFWLVDLTHEDGFRDRYYLDTETYLIVAQRSEHALHPAVDPEVRRWETRYSDYREVDGVLYPFLSEKYDIDTGERAQTVTIKSRRLNIELDPEQFVRPQ